jgi:enterochelin esterase-like enzyme
VPGHLEEIQLAGRRVIVDVPGAYAAHRGRSFPVLYLLHGYPATPDAAIAGLQVAGVADQLVASHRLPPTLVVVPDGNGGVRPDAEWGNNPNGNRVETWLVTQAVPAIDAHYRTLGAAFRGIAGYSSGGFGAVNLAMRHPDVFRWAASWSGYFEGRRDIFVADAAANSPDRTARRLSAAQRMPVYLGAGARDAYFLDATRSFDAELRSLGWTRVRTEVVPGGHGAEAWRAQMVSSLVWLGSLWVTGSCPESPAGCTGVHDG